MQAATSSAPAFVFPKTMCKITLGRDSSCNVPLKGIGSSRVHAVITIENGLISIEDCNSTFGTRVDGKPVEKAVITDGAVITVGVSKFKVQIDNTNITLLPVKEPEKARDGPRQGSTAPAVTIGRDPANSICLSHPLVSRFHATFRDDGHGHFVIEDHGSTNRTFVNGNPVHHSGLLDEGDIVQVGPYRFFLDNGTLQQAQDFNRIKMEAFNLTVKRRKHTLINDISLSIEPGEFVAILGPSGAGKSTLAHALTGQIMLSGGSIFYNGLPMRKFCSAFNSAIGFVSQQNLLRPELTVLETFTEQSMLRLPRDSMPAEHRERIHEVMDLLDLTGLKNRRIAHLSGGEAKRVHFGIELLSSPTVIFLDEPLAGLDPGLTHKFMELFRAICDKGHTILLTTHTLEQIELCNRLLFVSRGRLTFAGTPDEMRVKFGTLTLSEVYEKARILQPDSPASAPVTAITKNPKNNMMSDTGYAAAKLYRPKTVSFLRQMVLLVSRYCKVLVRDTRTLGLMFVQAPLIAVLLAFVFKPDSNFLPLSFYFCISISAIWMGGMNSVREIAREWSLIEREFRIGLSKTAYGISKIIVFCVLGAVQALAFGICMHFLFANFNVNLSSGVLLCTACAAGSLLGLTISVFSRNVNMAISFLPIIFIPQIFFSGILMPFDEMPAAGTVLSHLTVSRPVFSMFKKMSFFDQSLWHMDDWMGLLLLCTGLIILLFTGIRFRRIVRGSGF
jgi:ABC transport system ATP-binding/permease protein